MLQPRACTKHTELQQYEANVHIYTYSTERTILAQPPHILLLPAESIHYLIPHSQPITVHMSDRRNSQPTEHVISTCSNDHSTSQRSQLPTRQRMVQLANPSCRVNVPCAPPCSTSLPLPTRTCRRVPLEWEFDGKFVPSTRWHLRTRGRGAGRTRCEDETRRGSEKLRKTREQRREGMIWLMHIHLIDLVSLW
jgi:hypothetical protein